MEGKSQETAAAMAGMSVRSARTWEDGALPSSAKKPRAWRTRDDPFADVWTTEVVPLLEKDKNGRLQAKTVFQELRRKYPKRYKKGQLRTLQRRVRDWRALHGPDRDVIFPQEHPPGREGAFDFTHCTALGVTIGGVALVHLLFVFRLGFSGWTWVQLAYGETFEAVASGLQGALWALGGVTEVVRHDNLSAATHELRKAGGRSLNKRFQDVLDHYGAKSTRIRPGESHENGIVEKGNDLVKTALEQALILRGHSNFVTLDAYKAFVDQVVADELNADAADKLAVERAHLKPLPSTPVPSHTVHAPKVRSWSTVRVAGRTYSVPSRLIGHTLEVRQHPDVLEAYYNGQLVETMPRLRGSADVGIDYRHVSASLVRKPGAFARYRFREELFPSLMFRMAYDALKQWRGDRADIEYVRILHLAATTMESLVETALQLLLETGKRFDYAAVKELAMPEEISVPKVHIPAPNLQAYDELLEVSR